MTAPIVAAPPAPPQNVVPIPSTPTIVTGLPAPSLTTVNSAWVPVIPPFLLAGFGGTTATTAVIAATTAVASKASCLGSLTASAAGLVPVGPALATTGTAWGAVVVTSGGPVAVSAQFSGYGTFAGSDAPLTSSGALSLAISATVSTWASFGGIGSATATVTKQ